MPKDDTLESLTRSIGRLHARVRELALRSKQTAAKDKKPQTAPAAPPVRPKPKRAKPAPPPPSPRPAARPRQPVPPQLRQYTFSKQQKGRGR